MKVKLSRQTQGKTAPGLTKQALARRRQRAKDLIGIAQVIRESAPMAELDGTPPSLERSYRVAARLVEQEGRRLLAEVDSA